MAATRFTNLEVTGTFTCGDTTHIAKTSVADATAAAGSAPTAAEFKKVVDLVNDLKAKYNALVDAIT